MTQAIAYTDGAVQRGVRAGWGTVIHGPVDFEGSGLVNYWDVMVAELWAVFQTVRAASPGVPLMIYTDSQSIPQLLSQGTLNRDDLSSIVQKIQNTARRRAIDLSCEWNSRENPGAQSAHALAVAGRDRGFQSGIDPGAQFWIEALTGGGIEVGSQRATARMHRRLKTRWEGPQSLPLIEQVIELVRRQPLPLEIRGPEAQVADAARVIRREFKAVLR